MWHRGEGRVKWQREERKELMWQRGKKRVVVAERGEKSGSGREGKEKI